MSDLALAYDLDHGGFDLVFNGQALQQSAGLLPAAIVSLFSDHRADNDDRLPDNTGDRRGWWADAYTDAGLVGSRLWLLARAKILADTTQRIEGYAREALQWMRDDAIASAIDIQAERQRNDTVALRIVITPTNALAEPVTSTISERLVIDGQDVEVLVAVAARTLTARPYAEYER